MKFAVSRVGLLITTSLGLAAPAFAQESAPSQSSGDNDIIVTARRVQERLQDVPISITVFNQQQLTERNIIGGQELARYTPSLTSNSNFGGDNATYAIRGFVQDIGTAPSVGVYFADVVAPRGGNPALPSGDGAGPGSFSDLQNVQVLKGPQGTLQGRNTTGGAVLLVPQKPTGRFEGYIEGSLGNYAMKRIQAVVNIPVNETLRIRLGVDRQTRDGYLHNKSSVGPSDFNDLDYIAARASIVADLAPNLENYTIISYSKSTTNGPLNRLIACNSAPSPADVAASIIYGPLACAQVARANAAGDGFYDVRNSYANPSSRLETWQVINTSTWQATDALTVKNIASYAQLRQNLSAGLFGTEFFAAPVNGEPSRLFPFAAFSPNSQTSGVANQSTFTDELQFQGRSGAKFTWQAGAYYERSDPLATNGSASPTSLYCTNVQALQCTDVLGMNLSNILSGALGFPVTARVGAVNTTFNRIYTQSVGTYAQGSYSLTERLTLTAGVRYTWDLQRSDTRELSYQFPVTPGGGAAIARCSRAAPDALPDCERKQRQTSNAPTWLINLDFKPVEDVMLYAKYARGYRTGGIKADGPEQYALYRPEKVDSYEIGVKTSFSGAIRGSFNLAGFYNDFANQQLQVGFAANQAVGSGVAATTAPVNAGHSRIYGVEIEAGLRPVKGLSLNASYAYLNAKLTSVTPVMLSATDPYVVNGQPLAGDRLALTPESKLVVSGSYTFPLSEDIGEISVGATFSHTSSVVSSYASRSREAIALFGRDIGIIDPVDLLNLNASWRSIARSPVDLSIFVTNLTKAKYYTYITGLYSGTGFEMAQVGEPRVYGARLKYNF